MSLVSKELFQEVQMKGGKGKEIIEIITKSYLDPSYDTKWMPAKMFMVQNRNLEQAFYEKIKEFEGCGSKCGELEPKFGFLIENDMISLLGTCQSGLSARDSEYNTIGYNFMGVYLCKHSDTCLQHAIVKFSASDVIRMIIFKYVTGKTTTAIPRVATVGEFIEPTPGFNSHVSVIHPTCKDSLQTQFDRSQVYLYEIDKFFQSVAQPRHLLPYALVLFTVNGVVLPQLESEFSAFKVTGSPVESLPAANSNPEVLSNLKLQQAIEQINSKAPPETMVLAKGSRITRPNESETSSICVLGSKAAMGLKAGSSLLNHSESSQLQKVIEELNARYEMTEGRGFMDENILTNQASSSASIAAVMGLDEMLTGMSNNPRTAALIGKTGRLASSLQHSGYSSLDLLSAGSNGLIHLTKPEISALTSQSLLGAYSTVGLLQGSNQLGILGGDSTLADLGTSVVDLSGNAYTQFQGVTLPTVAMPTFVTGLVDPMSPTILAQNGGATQAAFYQQEFIPVEYLSSMVTGGGKGSALQAAYYPLQGTPSGYALVNQGGLKRSLTDAGGSCIEKRPKIA